MVEKYVRDDDQFILEDESGRVTLCGDALQQNLLVTGESEVEPYSDAD